MARPASGQVLELERDRGPHLCAAVPCQRDAAVRTLSAGTTRVEAEQELRNRLADVSRGLWHAPEPAPVIEEHDDPDFHTFSSEWLAARRDDLGVRTVEDYEWALSGHLLPFFARYR